MSDAAPRSIGSRVAGWGLLVAWLALLGTLGAAGGYVLFLPGPDAEPMSASAPAPAVDLQVPPETLDGETMEARVEPAEPQAAPPQKEIAPAPPVVVAPVPETVVKPEADAPPPPEPAESLDSVPGEAPSESGQEAVAETQTAPAEAQAAPAETQEAALPALSAPALAPAPEVLPPWRRHAQPFDAPGELPRISVVLTGLGLSSAATQAAIKQLPSAISLSFTPYSRRLNEWVALARVNGHEVLLDLPMEPTSYPDDDPGPQALLTALSARQNLERLDWTLKRTTGFIGVSAVMGSRFLASEEHIAPILEELKNRGMLFLDSRASEASVAGPLALKIGMASAVNDRFLDRAQASRVAIDDRLVQLERIARTQGFAVAIGQTYPVTIERLRVWAAEVETRGFVLAPLSSIAAARLTGQTAAREIPEQ